MASPSLAIAKVSLAAGLMRPDPTPVPRDQLATFHTLLESALAQCSPPNIQRCKAWMLEHIASSETRVAVVGKYFVALSASFSSSKDQGEGEGGKQRGIQGRRQLHVLYIINDFLHHTKFHGRPHAFSTVASALQPHFVSLFASAAAYNPTIYPKHHSRIATLLNEWEQSKYYELSEIQKLREAVAKAGALGYSREKAPEPPGGIENGQGALHKGRQDAPYIMPATHGDPAAPYYDLPAANMMPHIIPNSATPISSQKVRPLQLVAGPADDRLVSTVKDFLRKVDILYGNGVEDEYSTPADIDDLGQSIIKDEITGEALDGEAYYGWSKAFCDRMKKRRDGKVDFSRPRPRSESPSRSPSPNKRRRYTSSNSSRRSRSRSSDVSRKYQRRSSPEQPQQRSSSRQLSRRRSRSPRPAFQSQHSRSRSRSRSRTYAPPRNHGAPTYPPPPPAYPPQFQGHGPPPPMPFPNLLSHGIPFGPDGLPLPPPPPPHYQGQWPPPPPAPPAPIGSNVPPFLQYPAYGAPPPPPTGAPVFPSNMGQGGGWATPGPAPPPPTGSYGGGRGYQQYGEWERDGRGRGGRRGWRG